MACCKPIETFEGTPLIFTGRVLVGSHVPYQGRICDSLEWAFRFGMYTVQMYMGSQISFTRSRISAQDIVNTKKLLDKFPTNLFTHSPVTFNLAGSVKLKSLAWSGNSEVDGKINGLLVNLNYEIDILNKIGGKGTVIHPGCYIETKDKTRPQAELEAIVAIATTLDNVVFNGAAKILLENCAGEHGKVAYSLAQLVKIRNLVKQKDHIGFCLDTAHLWGAGAYDLSKIEGVDQMFADIESVQSAGQGTVDLIHLNDSEVAFGSCVDRHALLRTGHIWSKSDEALKHLLRIAGHKKIPIVLETSPSDMYVLHELLDI